MSQVVPRRGLEVPALDGVIERDVTLVRGQHKDRRRRFAGVADGRRRLATNAGRAIGDGRPTARARTRARDAQRERVGLLPKR
jgi:hypothetical protein